MHLRKIFCYKSITLPEYGSFAALYGFNSDLPKIFPATIKEPYSALQQHFCVQK